MAFMISFSSIQVGTGSGKWVGTNTVDLFIEGIWFNKLDLAEVDNNIKLLMIYFTSH